MKKILILGANGFIGHHLSRAILATTDWHIVGMDLGSHRITELLSHPRMSFHQRDMLTSTAWIDEQVASCDVVLPLVAIATPATYVRDPLRVFELDFEANLPIVRMCVKHKKRLIFPSTSEVYGMCPDEEFDPDNSNLVVGPINKPRWIYSVSKQLMDRIIHAYGMKGELDYTLFRPFNWIGAGLDSLTASNPGGARVITQFLGHIIRGEPIQLVDGGAARRSFTDVDDAIRALMTIIDNPNNIASGKIYNIGNPSNNHSIRELAETLLQLSSSYEEYQAGAARTKIVETSSGDYYGKGYQDVPNRTPKISNTVAELKWQPSVTLAGALKKILEESRAEARTMLATPPAR
ncbi:MAG: bifunctional UDP-4-keto-pentose/UDP-xylose synthase [Burkholderiales bacterium]|nr:bifunctional UDP-4-keto-pentose/UDP-xylose synthase [Burkholderiales bacterium]